jgi:hypothetical protein
VHKVYTIYVCMYVHVTKGCAHTVRRHKKLLVSFTAAHAFRR